MDRVSLIDTNLLVLLCVGLYQRSYIARHKRTSQFIPEDHDLLLTVLGSYPSTLVTPNVLSECSNLCAQTGEPAKSYILAILRTFAVRSNERYVSSRRAVNHPSYMRLGLTDAALHAAAKGATVITTDLDLYLSLANSGYSPVNFNHVREYGWAHFA